MTIAVLALNIYIFMSGDLPIPLLGGYAVGDIHRYCLHPSKILQQGTQWARAHMAGLPTAVQQLLPPLPEGRGMFLSRARDAAFPWQRLLFPAVVHADERHLYYNMISFAYKGALLEQVCSYVYTVCTVYTVCPVCAACVLCFILTPAPPSLLP